MQIAQALAGYSLGDADNLRRAMGKKKTEEMAKERERFLDGRRRTQGTPTREARGEIFDQMETFAAYGFNKSHSAAYARHHVPDGVPEGALPDGVHGRAAVARGGRHRQHLQEHRRVPRRAASRILPPDVNESREDFTAAGGRDPLRPRRGEGRRLEGDRGRSSRRATRGRSRACTTSACACASQLVNRRVIESLIKCGAFDSRRAQPRPPAGARSTTCMRWASLRAEERDEPADRALRGAAARPRAAPPRAARRAARGRPRRSCSASARRSASSSPAIRSTATSSDLRRFTNVTIGTLRTRGPELPAGAAAARAPGRRARACGSAASSTPSRCATARRAIATPPSSSRTRRAWSR